MTESDGTQNWASIKDQQDAAEFFHSFMNVLRNEAASTQEARVLLDQMFKISITQEFLCSGQPTEGCPAQRTRPLEYYGYLPIPAEKSNSVEDSLNTLFGKEKDVNKKCAHCPREVGSMLTTLATVPEILIIQLQRFRGGNNRAEKITRMITVPNTLRPQPDGQNYDLEFVVCHKGNLMGGHYVSLVKCPTSGVIYKVDDHHAVTRYLPSESDEQSGQAYMMMYRKQSDTVPSVIDDQLPAKKKPRLSSQDEPSISGMEEEMNDTLTDSLPTPPYTSIGRETLEKSLKQNQTVGPSGDIQIKPVEISQFTDITAMSRDTLINFCCQFLPGIKTQRQNTNFLRNSAYIYVFKELVDTFSDEIIDTLLKDQNIKPNKNKPKRKTQFINHCKNIEDKTDLYIKLTNLRTDLQNINNVASDSIEGVHQSMTTVESTNTLEDTSLDDSLPTPPYTSTILQTDDVVTCVQSEEADRRHGTDITIVSREWLLNYCFKYIPSMKIDHDTHRLRNSVCIDLLKHMIGTLNDVVLGSILKEYKIRPNKDSTKRRMQLINKIKKSENKFEEYKRLSTLCINNQQTDQGAERITDSLPTSLRDRPNFESNTDIQSDAEFSPQTDIHAWMSQFPNLANMTRENLQVYCQTYMPAVDVSRKDTNRLENTAFNNMFRGLIATINDHELGSIFLHFGLHPERHIAMRRGQLKRFFNTSKHKITLLTWLMQKSGPQNKENASSTCSYSNDFYPENLEQIMENKNQLKIIRQQRIDRLKVGNFVLNDEGLSNPILEAGREMCTELRSLKESTCRICLETWPDMKIGERNKKCSRCEKERLPGGIPPTFSPYNDMDPGEQPECLKILNTVEQAAISLICPTMCIYRLRGGGSKLKGHSISFPQDVQGFYRSLPHRPEDLPFIVIKAPHQDMPLTANRHNIICAITWLKRNNPEYAHIEIDNDAANLYPEDRSTPVQNIPTHCDPSMTRHMMPPEQGENGQNSDSHADLDDDDLVDTVAPCEVPTLAQSDQIHNALAARQQSQHGQQTTVNWPIRGDQPASEWEPGYFSKSFPHLFPYGRADISKPRIGKKPEFLAYLRHLSRLYSRFAADERFTLHSISMYNRHKALTLGNVYGNNVCRNMSLAELKEKVTEDNETIMKSLVAFSSQIPGTKGYFAQESKKAVALEQWIRIMSDNEEMLNTFLTFSLPDFHMEELHQILPGSEEYLGKIVVPKMSDVPPDANADDYIDEKTDFLLRKKALKENGHLVDFFGQKKMDVLVDKILGDTLGIIDYVIRAEYQSRSTVHWHMAGRMLGVSMPDIIQACKKYKFDVKETTEEHMTEEDIERQRKELIEEGVILDHPDTQEFREEVAASREKVKNFTVLDLGLSACHPQSDPKLWPGPEGQNVSKPPTNCLRTNFLDVIDINQDYELIINRVQLHSCRITYCLRKILEMLRCRFGFPLTLKGFIVNVLEIPGATAILNALERLDDFQSGAEIVNKKVQLLRNHPRLVVHVPEIALIWRGNTEAKLIDCPRVFLKYISKYMLKPEVASLAFKDIVKTLTLNAEENTPVRKIFQKIMMKTVSEHDMSRNECWKVISGRKYVTHSRPFRYLNLTGSRRVNLEENDNPEQPAVAKNFCDIYWSKETDGKYQALVDNYESGLVKYPKHPSLVSLYEFAGNFTNNWQPSGKLHIPKSTPSFTYVPIPENKDFRKAYCQTTLLLHKPGTTPHNLLDSHENEEDAMLDFALNHTICPTPIKEDFLASLKMTEADLENMNNNVEDLVASGASQAGNMAQEDWMIGLGDVVRPTDILDEEPILLDDEEDFLDLEPDDDVDWSRDRIELVLSNQDIDEATDWIPRMKVSAELEFNSNTVQTNNLNVHQRHIFEMMMNALEEDQPQKLIDVSGAAGSGKSYLINAILQQAQENTGHRNSVKIVAPTGSASSHFPDGITIHRLLKIPSKKGCGELDVLSGASLKDIQTRFKDTKAVIIDEKADFLKDKKNGILISYFLLRFLELRNMFKFSK